jgi:hypothetical protein
MTDESTPSGHEMIVTVLQNQDPERDNWLVTGPYWEPGGAEEALAAFSQLIDGEAEAMEYANELVAGWPGCKLHVERREG